MTLSASLETHRDNEFFTFPYNRQLAYYLQRLDRNCEDDSASLEAKSDGCSKAAAVSRGGLLMGENR